MSSVVREPKYDNDNVSLGYLKKMLGQNNEELQKVIEVSRNFGTQPIPPYQVGDTWTSDGKIYVCIKERLMGSFFMSDWKIVANNSIDFDNLAEKIFDVNKIEYLPQSDGKIETFYSENDPSIDWDTSIVKEQHVSDFWFDKTNGKKYQYMKYNTNPITYNWKEISISNSIFDLVDGHKNLFVDKPSNYGKDDIWFIGNDEMDLPENTSPGDTVMACVENTIYNKEDFIKRDEFVSSSETKFSDVKKIYLTPVLSEIERNTLSEIKKAIDEISLTVSQNYTTKEEMKIITEEYGAIIDEQTQTITTQNNKISQLDVNLNNISSTVSETEIKMNEFYTEEQIKMNNVTQTLDSFNISISEQQKFYDQLNNSVVKLEGSLKNMEFDFSTRGLSVGMSIDPNNALIDNTGIKVFNYQKLNAIFNYKGSGIEKLIVTGTAQIGYLKFVKSTKNGKHVTKIYHLKSLIEDLEDLI